VTIVCHPAKSNDSQMALANRVQSTLETVLEI